MSEILVVEDMENPRQVLTILLKKHGYSVEEAENGAAAIGKLKKKNYDLVVTDLKMEPVDGLEVLRETKTYCPNTQVILLTAFGSIDNSVDAMKLGAFDYFTKPYNADELLKAIKRALNKNQHFYEKIQTSPSQRSEKYPHIIGCSESMDNILSMVERIAQTDCTALISGESGTGKELIAKAIHAQSTRSGEPLISINCGALPESLLESELFGHVKGSFTGAAFDRKGLFAEADGGTIFLDEIGEISQHIQVNLLRVLQEGEIRPVGSNKSIKVNVRVIAASNKNLKNEVEQGNFRQDLYYRLNVIPIYLPSLKERMEDVPLLIKHFIKKYSTKMNRETPNITNAAMEKLLKHDWPGNVRELENLIERTIALTSKNVIDADDFFIAFKNNKHLIGEPNFEELSLEDVEKHLIMKNLEKYGGNYQTVADKLGISKTTLWRKIKSYDIKTGGNDSI